MGRRLCDERFDGLLVSPPLVSITILNITLHGLINCGPGTGRRRATAVVPLNGEVVVLVQQGVRPAHGQEEDHQCPPCAEHALVGQQGQQVGSGRLMEETDQCGQSTADAAMRNTYTPAVAADPAADLPRTCLRAARA